MNIVDYLSPERVRVSNELQSKKRALEELSRMLGGQPDGPEPESILASLAEREKLGSTGLGDGVAIPHGRMSGLGRCTGAFLRLDKGVDYDANDGKPVDLVFGLLVPEDTNETHLKLLAGLAELFTDDAFCARLRWTTQPQELLQLFSEYSPETTSQN